MLYEVITYLLCRIADTIEDEPRLSPGDKQAFIRLFLAALTGDIAADEFSAGLLPRLSEATPATEQELIAEKGAEQSRSENQGQRNNFV